MKKLVVVSASALAGLVFAVTLLGVALLRLEPVRAGAPTGQGGTGDTNGDGVVDISDAVFTLLYLFKGGPPPVACADSPELVQRITELEADNIMKTVALNGCLIELEATKHGLDETSTQLGQCQRDLAQCDVRFADNLDGTVTDRTTGLMWQKDTADVNGDGMLDGGDLLFSGSAFTYCENLVFAGHDDWRLPQQRELFSIVDVNRLNPAIDPIFGAFPPVAGSSPQCWTSLADGPPDVAWYVEFYSGTSKAVLRSNNFLVRAVRKAP